MEVHRFFEGEQAARDRSVTSKHDESVRWCKRCQQLKPKDRFLAWSTRGGAVQQRGHCLDCRQAFAEERSVELVEYRRQYNAGKRSVKRERDRQRKKEVKAAVNELKNVPCLDCNNRFPSVAMDFDHLDTKTKSIATMVAQGYKIDLILEEIRHCEIVCACCHRVRTEKRKQNLARVHTAQPKMRKPSLDLAEDIFALFCDSASSLSVLAIQEKLGSRYGSISRVLRQLSADGKLTCAGRGVYRLPESDLTMAVPDVRDFSATDRVLASMPQRDRVLAWFAMNPAAVLSTAEASSLLSYGDKPTSIPIILWQLCKEGRLAKVSRGLYRLPTQEEAAQQVSQKVTPSMRRERERLTRMQETAKTVKARAVKTLSAVVPS